MFAHSASNVRAPYCYVTCTLAVLLLWFIKKSLTYFRFLVIDFWIYMSSLSVKVTEISTLSALTYV
jgi:hypothetical protein